MAQNDQEIIQGEGTVIYAPPGRPTFDPDLEAEARGFVEGVPRDERFASRLDDINDQIEAALRGYENPVAPLVKNQLVLQFCMAGQESNPIVFHAFMQAFNESFQSKFKRDEVYGRTDPIPSYQGTTRAITISFKLVADNTVTAIKNMNSINKMVSFLYPTYDGNIINKAPILGLKYMNMGQEDAGSGWLYGTMGGFSINPDMEFGVFAVGDLARADRVPEDLIQRLELGIPNGVPGKGVTHIMPKVFTISCDFHPIHRKTLQAGMPNIVYATLLSDTTGRSPQGYFNKFTGTDEVISESGAEQIQNALPTPLVDRYRAAKGQILDQYESATAPGPVSGFFNKLFGPEYVNRGGVKTPNDGTGRFEEYIE